MFEKILFPTDFSEVSLHAFREPITNMKTLSIQVPDEIGILLEKDEILRRSIEKQLIKSFEEKMLKSPNG